MAFLWGVQGFEDKTVPYWSVSNGFYVAFPYIDLVMTSRSSGFLTENTNLSKAEPCDYIMHISVPPQNAVMISFKQQKLSRPWVQLYYRSKHEIYASRDGENNCFFIHKHQYFWDTHDIETDFANLYYVSQVGVALRKETRPEPIGFKLFFSFFPESQRPHKTPTGFWNCSVKHYTSFQHHVACNLKTECEDGRDETGECPYSSPECQGMIALCDRCYSIVSTLCGVDTIKSRGVDSAMACQYSEKASHECSLLGGMMSLPKCAFNSIHTLLNKTKIHNWRLVDKFTGLYTNDIAQPSMYIASLIHNDRTVLHHSLHDPVISSHAPKKCLMSALGGTLKYEGQPLKGSYGAFCELKNNKTKQNLYRAGNVLLKTGVFLFHKEQPFWKKCPNGHATYTFLLCDTAQSKTCQQELNFPCRFHHSLTYTDTHDSTDHRATFFYMFTCSGDSTVISYTLVCDFVTDCQDQSDEFFCEAPPCINMFRCKSGQCVHFHQVCDVVFHCHDKSDEQSCEHIRDVHLARYAVRPPALVNFDGRKRFISTPLNSTESCPGSHYRCLGDFSDCLPVYTRCNGLYDCIDHQDEERCDEEKCLGFFRCRTLFICLHIDHICDGWPHCPKREDELMCQVMCPITCVCQGHTFLCTHPFTAADFSQLRFLDATGSGMILSDVGNNTLLIGLDLSHCLISALATIRLRNLLFLDLSKNKLQHANITTLLGLRSLQVLSLSNNPLTTLQSSQSSVYQQKALTIIDLSHTMLTVFEAKDLSLFPHIQKLDLTSTSLHTISLSGFQNTPQLTHLYMDCSPVEHFPEDIFKGLHYLRFLSTQNKKFCCEDIFPYNIDASVCIAPKDEISSCKDLLQSWTYRLFLWLIVCLSVTGNVCCCSARLFSKSMTFASGFSVFVTNLTISDLLMGVYMAVIGVADEQFRGRYLHNDGRWRNNVACKVAGFLSLLSSEVSAIIIWFITLDRFVVIHFPFSTMKFNGKSASVVCLFIWFLGCLFALVPLLPMVSHWEFYSQTGICIPLPITRQDFKGKFYSFSVLIVLNFILFLCVSAGQALVYRSIQDNTLKSNSTKVSRDMIIARRLITVAVTDFMCWFPIGLCGVLAAAGIPIPGEMNVALAVFVLPLNSAINPFMYTFNTWSEKTKKRNEAKLQKWLESHPDLIAS